MIFFCPVSWFSFHWRFSLRIVIKKYWLSFHYFAQNQERAQTFITCVRRFLLTAFRTHNDRYLFILPFFVVASRLFADSFLNLHYSAAFTKQCVLVPATSTGTYSQYLVAVFAPMLAQTAGQVAWPSFRHFLNFESVKRGTHPFSFSTIFYCTTTSPGPPMDQEEALQLLRIEVQGSNLAPDPLFSSSITMWRLNTSIRKLSAFGSKVRREELRWA